MSDSANTEGWRMELEKLLRMSIYQPMQPASTGVSKDVIDHIQQFNEQKVQRILLGINTYAFSIARRELEQLKPLVYEYDGSNSVARIIDQAIARLSSPTQADRTGEES